MSRSLWPAAVVLICVAIDGYVLARSYGEPSNDGIRRYVVGEIADDVTVGQTFAARAGGLSSITVHPRAVSPGPAGVATFEVRDISGVAPVIVQRATAPVDALAAAGAFTIRFPPQPSFGRRYEVEMRLTQATRGHGIGLLATRGDGYRDGSLQIRGRPRWGDLVFEGTADESRSNFAVLVSRLREVGVPAAAVVLALAVAGKNAALWFVLHAFARPNRHV